MSDTNAQEPTMEEILASIRRIISEDETPADASAEADTAQKAPHEEVAAAAAAEPPPPPKAEPPKAEALRVEPPKLEPVKAEKAPKPEKRADVLELTQRVEAAAPNITPPKAAPPPLGDIDFSDAPPPPAAASPGPAPRPPAGGSLVSDTAATAAAGHFGQLAQSVAAPTGRSLEEMVTEMLRPMLKDWLDANLPKIVEASVASEVERISRRGY